MGYISVSDVPGSDTHVIRHATSAFMTHMIDPSDPTPKTLARCRKKNKGDWRHCDSAYAWAKGSVRLTDMRCPKCGGDLSRTTRDYQRTFWWLSKSVTREIALPVLYGRRDDSQQAASETDNEWTAMWARDAVEDANKWIKKLMRSV